MNPTWKDDEYGIELYHADCLDVLPELADVDAVITDPPYGIKMDKGFSGSGGFPGSGRKIKRRQYKGNWDDTIPDKLIFDMFLAISRVAIIFGGNYFTHILPVGSHWFVWDKKNTMPTFSDCELAWTNINKKSVKLFEYMYNGLLSKNEDKKRYHPTQKPTAVMKWCINQLSNDYNTILDPFMGSGTTGVAAVQLGRKFIGIEMEKEYFDISVKRIKQAIIDKQGGELFATHQPEEQNYILELDWSGKCFEEKGQANENRTNRSV